MAKGIRKCKNAARASIVASLDFDDILTDNSRFTASIQRTSEDRRRVYHLPMPMPMPSPPKKKRRIDVPETFHEDNHSDIISLGINESLFYNQDALVSENNPAKDKQSKRYKSSVS